MELQVRNTLLAASLTAGALFAVLLGVMFHSTWGMTWRASVVMAVPLSVAAQFIAGSARFTCRSSPLGKTEAWRIVVMHLVAGLVLGSMWVGLSRLVAEWAESGLGLVGVKATVSHAMGHLYGVGFAYYLLGAAFQYMMSAQQASSEAMARAAESSLRARDAELNALKAQINPHFLYNSLNSISALTSIDPARAREMCVLLADFLRMTLGMGEKPLIPLKEELGLLEKYCAIEKVRFGERFKVQMEVPGEAQECLVPPLLLQPLVENAVVHGIAQMPEGGWVKLRANCQGERVSLQVENSWDPEAVTSRRNGVGMRNVQRRLEARFGNQAYFDARADEGIFRVTLTFPVERQEGR